MSLRLYMDQHVHGETTRQLRRRGIKVVTAEEDGRKALADPALLDRAGAVGCVLLTHDSDLLVEATRRQRNATRFGGVVYGHLLDVTVGRLVRDVELIASAYDRPEMVNPVEYLPL